MGTRGVVAMAIVALAGPVSALPMSPAASDPAPIRLVQTVPLPGVEGRIDHLAVDVAGQRLFVAALGNNTVEVVDLKQGVRVRSLPGFKEPQGLAYLADARTLAVANAGDGVVTLLDGASLAVTRTVDFGDDADNLRYDPARKRLYVGFGAGALGVFDTTTGQPVTTLEADGDSDDVFYDAARQRLYACFGAGSVVVYAQADGDRYSVLARVPTAAGARTGLFSPDLHRLFVAVPRRDRPTAEIRVFDTGP
jgi:DNA-binding beta-propeller fold protein YncE